MTEKKCSHRFSTVRSEEKDVICRDCGEHSATVKCDRCDEELGTECCDAPARF